MPEPRWIWTDPAGQARNAVALFRREFVLAAMPEAALLHLSADLRYRLSVNGEVVGYGPPRSVPAHPVHDGIDLRPWLRPGRNVLAVEVVAPNASNYQSMPEASAGFIAWGEVRAGGAGHDLATPGAWQAASPEAWDALAPAYSFAQAPVEILDLARLPADWAEAPAALAWRAPSLRADPPWGACTAHGLPPLGLRLHLPARLARHAALDDGEERVCGPRRLLTSPRGRGGVRRRYPYALVLRSPTAQRLRLGLFWGPHWLNGVELRMQDDAVRGNRQEAECELRAGDNLLYGEPEPLTEVWGQYAAWPRAAGLVAGPLRCGPVLPEDELARLRGAVPADAAGLARLPFAWEEGAGAVPAREMAWDVAGAVRAEDAPVQLPLAMAGPSAAVFDFAGEFLGHVRFELEAPAGTIVDLASDERRRADGLLALYASNPFIDGADRIIWAGGRRTVELLHPRGGRWLQLTVRPPAGGSAVLHALALRDHQVPVAREGAFACADPVFAWTWEASYRTLQACVEDAFVDCPWRERGTYLGDALVETATLAAWTSDLAVAKRSLRLWAQGQLPDGQMQPCVPSWHRHAHEDFTLIWILLLHDLWCRDGDLADAREFWPVVERILASPHWHRGADGLWDLAAGTDNQFIDWGASKEDKRGDANACLNAFRCRALACAGGLAGALGLADRAAALAAEAVAVAAAWRARLWLADEGRFARCAGTDGPDRTGAALHGNVLALAFGLADAAQVPRVLAHVEAGLARNLATALHGRGGGYLDLYFLSYALDALYRHGRAALAESVMRSHWGLMQVRGAWTIWECVGPGAQGRGSLCHAWSTTPARWFHERILGVRRERPGDPDDVLIDPDSTLDWAEGVVPHPAGPIRVAWRRVGGRIRIDAAAPPRVRLRYARGDGAEVRAPSAR